MTAVAFCPRCGAGLQTLAGGPDAGRPACPTGHYVFYENPAVSVMGFVTRPDAPREYLTLLREREPERGRWDMPGGFVEPDETPGDALRRELSEETGLQVSVQAIIGIYPSRYGQGGKPTLDIALTATAVGGRWRLSDESGDARWLELTAFPELAFASERRAHAELMEGLPAWIST